MSKDLIGDIIRSATERYNRVGVETWRESIERVLRDKFQQVPVYRTSPDHLEACRWARGGNANYMALMPHEVIDLPKPPSPEVYDLEVPANGRVVLRPKARGRVRVSIEGEGKAVEATPTCFELSCVGCRLAAICKNSTCIVR